MCKNSYFAWITQKRGDNWLDDKMVTLTCIYTEPSTYAVLYWTIHILQTSNIIMNQKTLPRVKRRHNYIVSSITFKLNKMAVRQVICVIYVVTMYSIMKGHEKHTICITVQDDWKVVRSCLLLQISLCFLLQNTESSLIISIFSGFCSEWDNRNKIVVIVPFDSCYDNVNIPLLSSALTQTALL